LQAWLDSGQAYVRSLAARLAVDLLAPEPGERILDVCAAPGGKAIACAEAVGELGLVVAADLPGPRLDTLRRNVAVRAGLRISVVPAAAEDVEASCVRLGLPTRFSAVLVDAPCSNTGVWCHKPDARWRLRPDDLPKLTRTQRALLDSAAACVEPGGRLVYSTCSLERLENEDLVSQWLNSTIGQSFRSERTERWWPWQSGDDGAFASVLRRVH
jgi:16S rRNA (cytosine967-C5)-methyltransferase